MMKIGEAKKWLTAVLKDLYPDSEAQKITSLLLEHATGISRINSILQNEQEITPQQNELLVTCVKRLQQHEPVQYIMNKAWFYGLELYVDNSVLIPRPETEELVHWVINDVKDGGNSFQKGPTEADATKQLKILDVGVGSGCIALAIKKALPAAEVWGCDVSDEALNIARRNGSALDIRVDFQGVDFLNEEQQKSLPTVHIIISNPPYIPAGDKESLDVNVAAYEPHTALFVPTEDPLLFYKAIVQFSKKRLYEGCPVYLEINDTAAVGVIQLFSDAGFENITLKKDMQGKDRMIKATSPA